MANLLKVGEVVLANLRFVRVRGTWFLVSLTVSKSVRSFSPLDCPFSPLVCKLLAISCVLVRSKDPKSLWTDVVDNIACFQGFPTYKVSTY